MAMSAAPSYPLIGGIVAVPPAATMTASGFSSATISFVRGVFRRTSIPWRSISPVSHCMKRDTSPFPGGYAADNSMRNNAPVEHCYAEDLVV